MTDKAQLVITALQQRIGEIVSNYETQIAILRADYTNAMEQLAQKEKSLQVSLLKQTRIHIGLKMVKGID